MKVIEDISKMKTYARIMRKERKLIGFIPTMGCLHEGHLSLMRTARKQVDVVVASIFVNPTQFAAGEDFKKYPRNIKKDEELAKTCGVDVLFYPKKEDMYPAGFSTRITVGKFAGRMESARRPGHFSGVATVVAKLFEIVKPDIVYFGQKDAEQASLITQMIKDLNMDVTMKVLSTVREADGLATSSRNTYLTKPEREDATCLYEALRLATGLINSNERNSKKIIKKMRELIKETPSAKIDYISIVSAASFEDLPSIRGEALIAMAVFIGKTRLIDNAIIDLNELEKKNVPQESR